MARVPDTIDRDAPIFPISMAARLAGMHPQTLRTYDRLDLVVPKRTKGRGRRYSPHDVTRLRMVQYLSQDEGINLNGVRRILEMDLQIAQLRREADALTEQIRELRAAPPAARLFTASADGGVHLGGVGHQTVRREITRS